MTPPAHIHPGMSVHIDNLGLCQPRVCSSLGTTCSSSFVFLQQKFTPQHLKLSFDMIDCSCYSNKIHPQAVWVQFLSISGLVKGCCTLADLCSCISTAMLDDDAFEFKGMSLVR